MQFWPYPSCKCILRVLLLPVLMTAAKGKNAVEWLAEPLVELLAHQNVNVLNLLSTLICHVSEIFIHFG